MMIRVTTLWEIQIIHLRRACFVISIFVALFTAIYGQKPQVTSPEMSLSVSGEVERPLKLTAADLGKLPRRSVRAKDHDGKESEFEGSPLVEVLKLAGVKFGEGLRGKNLAQGALMSAVYLVGAPIILYVRHVPLNILVAMTAGFLSMLIIHLGAGNLFSVYWPRRIEFSQMSSRMTSGAAGFASLLVLLPTAAAIGGVILATWYWKLSWLPLPAALVGLGLSLVVYSWLTNWAVRHAQAHLEEIAGQLGV